jgi:hypothetical protein
VRWRHVVERGIADQASPKQLVRHRQGEVLDERRELVERCVHGDLDGAPRPELAKKMAITCQQHAIFGVRELDERAIVG